jgi:hypothetical protein
MDPKTKFAFKQPGTYATFLATAIPLAMSFDLVPPGDVRKWLAFAVALLFAYGVKSLASAEMPRTSWTEEQREAFRNSHPEVQQQVKRS